MSIEDELRSVMREHEDEAPTSAVLHVPDGAARRLPRWLPAAAAAVVVVIVGATVAITAHHGARPAAAPRPSGPITLGSSSPLRCPAPVAEASEPARQVPAPPRGVPAADRLVPDQAPKSVLLCGWIRRDGATTASSRVLTGDAARLVDDLGFAPPSVARTPCASYLAITDADTFLIGLTYPSGIVWVAAPGDHCSGSSNGTYSASTNFSDDVRTALRTGTWPATRSTSPHCETGTGRRGQEVHMVPGTPSRLRVCTIRAAAQGAPTVTDRVISTGFGELVGLLNRTATRASDNTCQGAPSTDTFALLFSYRDGPDVLVRLTPGCRPSIDNGNLAASDDTAVLRELHRLLR